MWLIENIGSIIVGAVVLAIITAIIISVIKAKRKGKCVGCTYCNGCSRACGTKPTEQSPPSTDKVNKISASEI